LTYISINQSAVRPARRVRSAVRPSDAKWSARRTLALVVGASLALWTLILSPFLFF
jgi:hypothetical protein